MLEDRHPNANLYDFREKQETELQQISQLVVCLFLFDLSVIKLETLVDRPILEEDSGREYDPPSSCWELKCFDNARTLPSLNNVLLFDLLKLILLNCHGEVLH